MWRGLKTGYRVGRNSNGRGSRLVRKVYRECNMNLSDFEITINGQPIQKVTSISFPDNRSKNQKRKDRKEYFKNKRKSRGSLSFTIEKEKPWHERIIVRGE